MATHIQTFIWLFQQNHFLFPAIIQSDLAASLNEFFASSYADGSMTECAEKYGVQAAVIEQK